MILRLSLILAVSLGLFGCSTINIGGQSRVLSVDRVKQDFASYEGQVISVEGWAGPCELDIQTCGLHRNRARADKGVIDGWALLIPMTEGFEMPTSGFVVVTGKIVITCRSGRGDDGTNYICLEQSGHLEPISIKPGIR